MSCGLRTIRTISRCVLLFVLSIAAAPSAALSESLVCHAIRGGETATQLARRITGDGRNKYQPWFQIMDASSRFVPKSQYDRIRPAWRACVVKEVAKRSVQPVAQRETLEQSDVLEARDGPVASSPPAALSTLPPIDGAHLMWVLLGAAVIVPLFGWRLLDNYASRRKTALIVMKHFGQRFVREFERPLIQQPADRPLRSQLRLSPTRARLEILLAPGQGKRYPNLSDHKKNVEYDVVRILGLLADKSFVRDPLYTQAGWVVVPFRFKVGKKNTGVRCISFF